MVDIHINEAHTSDLDTAQKTNELHALALHKAQELATIDAYSSGLASVSDTDLIRLAKRPLTGKLLKPVGVM